MKKYLKYAFVQTIPVLFGYLFLGTAFGLMLQKAGYHFIWAILTSVCIYAGSMQFVLVGILGSGMSLLSVVILTLSINSRHMFYGLSFIEKFKSMGKRYPYMVFSLTDETYSLLCSTKVPEDLSEKKVFFSIALLDHGYWVLGSVIGTLAGQLITFNSTGIDFAMTALFVVIFIEQWLESKSHIPAVIGILCGILSLLLFGTENFILPSMVLSVFVLSVLRPYLSKQEVLANEL